MVEKNFTKIPNDILENLARMELSGGQYRVLLIIIRNTYGFHRKGHDFGIGFLQKATGLSEKHTKRVVNELIKMKILIVLKEPGFNNSRRMGINENFAEWGLNSPQVTKNSPGDENGLDPGDENVPDPGDENVPQERKVKENNKETDINNFFEKLWNLYPNKKGKSQINFKQKEKLYFEVGEEKFKKAILKYKKGKEGSDKKYIMHGNNFFNYGYEDYLPEEDSNIVMPKGKIKEVTDKDLEEYYSQIEDGKEGKAYKDNIRYFDRG